VRWTTPGTTPSALRYWANGDTIVLEAPRTRDHAIRLDGLAPSTSYTYSVSLDGSEWSRPVRFRTFPEPGNRDPFTFLALGDSGTRNDHALNVAKNILREDDAALLLHVGDLAYEDGTRDDFTGKHFAVYAPFLARVPHFAVPGNHEFHTSLAEPFVEAFRPLAERPSGGAPYYMAFTHGNVRFIGLNTEDTWGYVERHGYVADTTSAQYRWLARELERSRDAPDIDWIVAFQHHPPYSASTGFSGHGSDITIRDALTPLFDAAGVDLVFTGHDHDYQRSKPIRGNEIVADGEGTVYVVTGGGGGKRLFRGTGVDWFTAYSERSYHHVRIRVEGADELELEAIDEDGDVIDRYTLLPTDPG